MKIRRAMAVAAATAVIAPAAFLAAPAAYAADGGTGTARTTPDDQNPPPAEDDEVVPPPVDDDVAPPPADDDVVAPPSDDDGTVEPPANGDAEAPRADEGADTAPGDDGENGDDGNDGEIGDGDEVGDEVGEDDEEAPTPPDEDCVEADFKATLSGLPSKIVSGSGWKKFDLNLDNTNGEKDASVDLGAVVLYKKDAQGSFESSLTSTYAQFEYFNGKDWGDGISDGGSIAGGIDVKAGETYSIQLRLKIAAKAPAGSAVAIAFGVSVDEDLKHCFVDEKWYSFEVLAADSDPGEVPPAEPEDGKSPTDVKPQGGAAPLPAAANGNLAETGSSSALPVIGMVAGLAIVAGGGVVFALRRRGGGAVA